MSQNRDDLTNRLSAQQFDVTQNCGTEPPFTGIYWDNHDQGAYHCVVCAAVLFDSDTKYDSGTGWPSFFSVTDSANVRLLSDKTHGMTRTEVRCANCDAHLGHLFDDGPAPTGQRYCMNSASLNFVAQASD